MSRRIVLATLGTYGDLHPYLAIALELQARGHRPVIATTNSYGDKVRRAGIEFHPVRPNAELFPDEQELARRVMDSTRGPAYVICDILFPHLRDSYEDTLEISRDADLLVSHQLTYSVPLVAEKLGKPWVGSVLTPCMFFSAYDPPLLPNGQFLAPFYLRSPWMARFLFQAARVLVLDRWTRPVHALRREVGLPKSPQNPLMDGLFSPHGNLAIFSRLLGSPQRDWPDHTTVTGFAFYDRAEHHREMPEELEAFLQSGPPPIVFTLGTSAVRVAGNFYRESLLAAKKLGRRAVFLVGSEEWNHLEAMPEGMIAVDYAPYSELFPRAAAIVHQGGAGTTGQAMRAGKPMVVVPFSHDQPDYALRLKRLGISETVSRFQYTGDTAAAALQRVLDDPLCAQRAASFGEQVAQEDGIQTACDVLEQIGRRYPEQKALSPPGPYAPRAHAFK